MFAIVKTGGKQYRVGVGDQITVERLEGDGGAAISLDQVLAGGGQAPRFGTPVFAGAWVTAKIVQQPRGTKIIVFKKKRRKNYRRKRGHRQELTVLKIEEISRGTESVVTDGGSSPVAPDSETTPAASDVG